MGTLNVRADALVPMPC